MQIPVAYELAMARKYPEQVAIAMALDPQGKPNPLTLNWLMNTSIQPPMLAISIGRSRYTLEAIRLRREFVVCLPSTTMTQAVIFFGTKSGRHVDKLAACEIPTQPAQVVGGVLLADAVANFECRVEAEVETGDHVLFVGCVVAAHMHPDPAVRRLFSLGNERLGGAIMD